MKIKRCPFCSKIAKIIDTSQQLVDNNNKYYDVGCGTPNCYLELGAGYSFETKEEAIKLWNQRKNV